MIGRSMRRLAASVGVALVVAAGAAPSGAAASPEPVASTTPTTASHRHGGGSDRGHGHGHGHHGCDRPRLVAGRYRFPRHCGPPPTVPEVPLNLLLPLSAGALAGTVVAVRRRHRVGGRFA